MPFSKAWQAETKRRAAVRYAERQLKKGKATAHTVGVLRDEARRLERAKGITGQTRTKSDRQLKKLSPEELEKLARYYQQRLAAAEMEPRRPRPKPGAQRKPGPDDYAQTYHDMPGIDEPEPESQREKVDQAWNMFRDWLEAHGYSLEPGSELSDKINNTAKYLAFAGNNVDEIFTQMCAMYIQGYDIEEI